MTDVYFSLNGAGRVRLPVTPGRITVTSPGRSGSVSLIDNTEISIPGGPGLREIAFEALLPNARYPFAVYDGDLFRPANFYLTLLTRLKNAASPFLFTVGGGETELSLEVTLEDFTIVDDAANGRDIEVGIRLREVRSAAARALSTGGYTAEAAPETVVTGPGDTLWSVAKRTFGDGSRWVELASGNRGVPPNRVPAGTVLRVNGGGAA
jgi:hypothetical protein